MPVDIESSAGASGERDAGAPVYQVVDEDTGEVQDAMAVVLLK